MNATQLARANELMVIIKQTTIAVTDLGKMLAASKSKKPTKQCVPQRDSIYNFCIAEYSDGSGMGADLSRYEGNDELLEVIIQTLNKQIQSFDAEFSKL
jgi:hypothetical protein